MRNILITTTGTTRKYSPHTFDNICVDCRPYQKAAKCQTIYTNLLQVQIKNQSKKIIVSTEALTNIEHNALRDLELKSKIWKIYKRMSEMFMFM